MKCPVCHTRIPFNEDMCPNCGFKKSTQASSRTYTSTYTNQSFNEDIHDAHTFHEGADHEDHIKTILNNIDYHKQYINKSFNHIDRARKLSTVIIIISFVMFFIIFFRIFFFMF